MNTEKWKSKPLSAVEFLAATDKGFTFDAALAFRERFAAWKDFIICLGLLPDAKSPRTSYLFFDTETTGLPKDWSVPISQLDNWPRLVQLAWLAYNKTETRVAGGTHIIKPAGFTIPAEASKIHGITTEKALAIGESLPVVLNLIHHHIGTASVLIGHNIGFDTRILAAEFLRAGLPKITPARQKVCTMLASTKYCALPSPRGHKWPKLQELHQKLFNQEFSGAHDAAADIAATAKCFWELRRLGIIQL